MADFNSTMDEMKYTAWSPFSFDGNSYFVKYQFMEKAYCLMVSDLVQLYFEELGELEIQQRCENLNPGIEMPLERVVKQIKKSVEDALNPGGPRNVRSTFTVAKQSQEHLELKAESYVVEVMFVWFFTLHSRPSSVSTYFVMPLLGMCLELKRRNRELIQIIRHKDEEIEDYKMNGAKVTRKRLETKPFMESDFMADMDKSQSLLESLKEPAEMVLGDSLYSTVIKTQDSLKRKAKEIEENSKNEAAKRVNIQHEFKTAVNEDSGFENRKEEMQRRVLLEQQLGMKAEKKKKKKAMNF